jgi:hypothetical protein
VPDRAGARRTQAAAGGGAARRGARGACSARGRGRRAAAAGGRTLRRARVDRAAHGVARLGRGARVPAAQRRPRHGGGAVGRAAAARRAHSAPGRPGRAGAADQGAGLCVCSCLHRRPGAASAAALSHPPAAPRPQPRHARAAARTQAQIPLAGCSVRVAAECLHGKGAWWRKGPLEVSADGGRALLGGCDRFYLFAPDGGWASCGVGVQQGQRKRQTQLKAAAAGSCRPCRSAGNALPRTCACPLPPRRLERAMVRRAAVGLRRRRRRRRRAARRCALRCVLRARACPAGGGPRRRRRRSGRQR